MFQGYNCAILIQYSRDNSTLKKKMSPQILKVKVVPYTFVRRGVPVREDTYPEPSTFEVGWPVPFLAAFISPVLPLGTHLLLDEQ